MNIHNITMDEFLLFMAGLIGFAILSCIINIIIKNQDNGKELKSRQVKVLEKTLQQGKIEWYILESEDGERFRLRNIKADELIISIGDKGVVTYRGQTIQAFRRTE